MTIPIDELYNYIHSLVKEIDENTLIYYFYPHGSKKIKDLQVLLNYNESMPQIYLPTVNENVSSWGEKLLFCYDQEPLNFDLYTDISAPLTQLSEYLYGTNVNNIYRYSKIYQQYLLKKNFAVNPAHVPDTIYDKKLLLHSEKNSEDLRKYEDNGFLGIYYWSHAFIALDWYRFAKHDKSLEFTKKINFKKDFNVYARSWTGSREYRLKFLEILSKTSIDKKSNIFFNHDDNDYSRYKFENSQWQVDTKNIDNLIYHTNENISSSASATYNTQDYGNSAIDIVLETVFDKNKIQLTEKILRPIACGKPFIIVSEKESLAYLKSYGFKTFSDLIDERYDSISDPKKRLCAVVNTMKKISNLPENEKTKLFLEMHKIAKENKNWFFSQKFFNIINNELIDNLKKGLSDLDNPKFQTAKNLRVLYRAFNIYYEYLGDYEKKLGQQFMNGFLERLELSKKNIGKY